MQVCKFDGTPRGYGRVNHRSPSRYINLVPSATSAGTSILRCALKSVLVFVFGYLRPSAQQGALQSSDNLLSSGIVWVTDRYSCHRLCLLLEPSSCPEQPPDQSHIGKEPNVTKSLQRHYRGARSMARRPLSGANALSGAQPSTVTDRNLPRRSTALNFSLICT